MTSTEPPSFTCPCCGKTSHNPADIEQGYCAACHWWTGDILLGYSHLEAPCPARTQRAELIERIMNEELARYDEAFRRLAEGPG